MKYLLPLIFSILLLCFGCTKERSEDFTLHIIHTTDVHGNLFPYDFINNREGSGSYARVAYYVEQLRKNGEELLLLDAGDILQGQPTAYYYNFIDTNAFHLVAAALNHMEYDAVVVGNHDIETGHKVYDKWMTELNMPLMAANVIRTSNNTEEEHPYFQPYVIFQKGGKRIALLGLTSPALTHQLPEVLWSGMRFEDQIETAQKYMPEILATEPDLIIAMIHSGIGEDRKEPEYMGEQVGLDLAKAVPELDIILMGHDHKETRESYQQPNGKVTWLINPANDANKLSHTTVTFHKDGTKSIEPSLVSIKRTEPSLLYLKAFSSQKEVVKEFVNQPVGHITEDMDARSSLFRPCTFIDLIHQLQFSIFPEAEISITAPLADNVVLKAGELYMRDLFNLYSYENMLYLMELTGEELKGLLEESYDRWIQTMASPTDPMLQINMDKLDGQYLPTRHPTFNFDSAAGMTYTIDVRMPRGERIEITKVGKADFSADRKYKVALNSYRGNGGGGLLTEGAGLSTSELKKRIINATDMDLRYFLIRFLKKHDPYQPHVIADWQFIPKEWSDIAIPRDSSILYQNRSL